MNRAIYCITLIISMSMLHCRQHLGSSTTTKPYLPKDPLSMPQEPAGTHQLRRQWLENSRNQTLAQGARGFNYVPVAHYAVDLREHHRMPSAPQLHDDHINRKGQFQDIFFAVRLSSDFWYTLPNSVQKSLIHEGIGINETDIFINVQKLSMLGEPGDNGLIRKTTHLAAHPWVDPDAPAVYQGTRVKRMFLHGVFESSYPDIAKRFKKVATFDIPLGSLNAVEVHTHDGKWSPRSGGISLEHSKQWNLPESLKGHYRKNGKKITKIEPTDEPQNIQWHEDAVRHVGNEMAFYSVVIGDVGFPKTERRGAVTLHWALSDARFHVGAMQFPTKSEVKPEEASSLLAWIEHLQDRGISNGPGFPMIRSLFGLDSPKESQ